METRATELEAELLRRRTPSQAQAAYAIENDNRQPEVDERPVEELSTSERQARAAGARRGRSAWRGVES